MQGLPNSLLRTDWRGFIWRRCINPRQFMLIDRSRGMTLQCFCDITNWTIRTCGFEASCSQTRPYNADCTLDRNVLWVARRRSSAQTLPTLRDANQHGEGGEGSLWWRSADITVRCRVSLTGKNRHKHKIYRLKFVRFFFPPNLMGL